VNSTVKIFLVFGLILSAPVACVPRRGPEAPVRVAPPPPPPPAARTATQKGEARSAAGPKGSCCPNAATALNEKLVRAQVLGVDDRTVAAISMKRAQGQAECVQANDECYAKVAKLLGGDRLLWAEMERVGKVRRRVRSRSSSFSSTPRRAHANQPCRGSPKERRRSTTRSTD